MKKVLSALLLLIMRLKITGDRIITRSVKNFTSKKALLFFSIQNHFKQIVKQDTVHLVAETGLPSNFYLWKVPYVSKSTVCTTIEKEILADRLKNIWQ